MMKINKQAKIGILVMIGLILAVSLISIVFNKDTEKSKVNGTPSIISDAEPALISIRPEGEGFEPATISVKTGTLVKWVSNDDDLNHKVVSVQTPGQAEQPSYSSELLHDEEVYTQIFTKPGTYNYQDETNPGFSGTIIVTD